MKAPGPVRQLLRFSTIAAALTGVTGALLGLSIRGWPGLLGGLLATGMVLGFLLVGQLPVSRPVRGRGGLAAALLVSLYAIRVLLLIAAYAVVVNIAAESVDRDVVGLTVIATAVAWTAATVWTALHWKPTLVEPDDPAAMP